MSEPTILSASQLQLGDTVQMVRDSVTPFATSMVVQVTENKVTLFRPYGHLGDFSYTGGVIPYIGTEKYDIERHYSSSTFVLLERKTLR